MQILSMTNANVAIWVPLVYVQEILLSAIS